MVTEAEAASVTLTVKVEDPTVVGDPAMRPLGRMVRPGGRSPMSSSQVLSPVPPLACRACEYRVPTVPDSSGDVLVIASVAAPTDNENTLVAVAPVLSVTLTVKVSDPVALGVPVSTPAVDNVSPAGGEPKLTVQVLAPDPPVAFNVAV